MLFKGTPTNDDSVAASLLPTESKTSLDFSDDDDYDDSDDDISDMQSIPMARRTRRRTAGKFCFFLLLLYYLLVPPTPYSLNSQLSTNPDLFSPSSSSVVLPVVVVQLSTYPDLLSPPSSSVVLPGAVVVAVVVCLFVVFLVVCVRVPQSLQHH